MQLTNLIRKPGKIRKFLIWTVLFLLFLSLLVPASYFGAQQLMLYKIRHDIASHFGSDYAILKLHMDGEKTYHPSLWRMLKTAYEYRFSDNYDPVGSAGLTGKKYYLTMLISNNHRIATCNWSFRKLGLDFDLSNSAWNIINLFTLHTAPRYRYSADDRVRKNGLWFSKKAMDDPEVRFYFHGVSTGIRSGAKANEDWPEARQIEFYLKNLQYPRGPADKPGGPDWYTAHSELKGMGRVAIPHLFKKLESADNPRDQMLILATIYFAVKNSPELLDEIDGETIEYDGDIWSLEHLDGNMRYAQQWYQKYRKFLQTEE